jgi:hypothetical protein
MEERMAQPGNPQKDCKPRWTKIIGCGIKREIFLILKNKTYKQQTIGLLAGFTEKMSVASLAVGVFEEGKGYGLCIGFISLFMAIFLKTRRP